MPRYLNKTGKNESITDNLKTVATLGAIRQAKKKSLLWALSI